VLLQSPSPVFLQSDPLQNLPDFIRGQTYFRFAFCSFLSFFFSSTHSGVWMAAWVSWVDIRFWKSSSTCWSDLPHLLVYARHCSLLLPPLLDGSVA
jgi:hypothetical protein